MTVNTQELRELVEKARWYAVDRYDLATQCSDRDDAHREAESCAAMWPKSAPYRAMQLIDAAAMPSLLDEIDRLRAALKVAEAEIQADREALLLCHGLDGEIPANDTAGLEGLAEYDEVLNTIAVALGNGNGDAP